jgi:uncharacterized iron-regulated protein
MKCNWILVCLLITVSNIVFAQGHLKAYQIFDNQGNSVSFEEMSDHLLLNDVVFFGELHNNPIAHWLQFELTKGLSEKKENKILLGAEMFERDSQLVLNEYLEGFINEKVLIKDANAWENYKTDYAPLVNYAKENSIPFIATNVPRRYASLVSKKGIEALENLSKVVKKNYLAPLEIEIPYENESYKAMEEMIKGHGMSGDAKHFVEAQAIKDATMGYSIVRAMRKKNKNKLFLHFNGDYHSKNHEGTAWYVNHYNDKLKVAVISFIEQSNIFSISEEMMGNNDYIIVCTKSMTKTF